MDEKKPIDGEKEPVTLEAGSWLTVQRSSLVMLEKDPLSDISNTRRIAGVMTQGRWLPVEQLQAMLAKLRQDNLVTAEFVHRVMRGGVDAGRRYYDDQKDRDPQAFVFSETPVGFLAFLLLKKGDVTGSLALLRLCAREYPESYVPHDMMTRILLRSGRPREARAALKEMLQRCPHHPDASWLKTRLEQQS